MAMKNGQSLNKREFYFATTTTTTTITTKTIYKSAVSRVKTRIRALRWHWTVLGGVSSRKKLRFQSTFKTCETVYRSSVSRKRVPDDGCSDSKSTRRKGSGRLWSLLTVNVCVFWNGEILDIALLTEAQTSGTKAYKKSFRSKGTHWTCFLISVIATWWITKRYINLIIINNRLLRKVWCNHFFLAHPVCKSFTRLTAPYSS